MAASTARRWWWSIRRRRRTAPRFSPPPASARGRKPPEGITAKVIVVAVKPQIIADVLPGLAGLVGRGTVTLSIAAGTTLANLAAGIGDGAIVRSIPNTPAQVGRGITAAIANERVSKAGRALVTRLLEAVGEVVWVDKEGLIDSVTAVSGSGPAYVFWLTECLEQAAIAAGLDKVSAAKLARATVTGAGELLYRSDLPAETLRKNVTSPKGTTEAALKVLMARSGGLGAADEEGGGSGEEALAGTLRLTKSGLAVAMFPSYIVLSETPNR